MAFLHCVCHLDNGKWRRAACDLVTWASTSQGSQGIYLGNQYFCFSFLTIFLYSSWEILQSQRGNLKHPFFAQQPFLAHIGTQMMGKIKHFISSDFARNLEKFSLRCLKPGGTYIHFFLRCSFFWRKKHRTDAAKPNVWLRFHLDCADVKLGLKDIILFSLL